jgi:predicted nucleic acid-binding protein
MRYVLDTNVVSKLRKGRTGKADEHVITSATSVSGGSLFLSAVTVLELEIGILLVERRDPIQGASLRSWIEGHVLPAFTGRVLSVDTAVALQCARLHVPDRVSERDPLIAATAYVH